jgi:3-hydroxyisobutyrate dehydrogenase-like beta-hydroxyacid dehydrogenase
MGFPMAGHLHCRAAAGAGGRNPAPAEAARLGLELPVATLVVSFYAEMQRDGCDRCDTSALIKRL